MKKILLTLICLAFIASQSMAQSYGNYNSNRSNNNSNYNNYNNNYNNRSRNWLDDMSYDAPDLYRSYRAGKTLSGLGMGFTLGGLGAAVLGFAAADKEESTSGGQTTVYLSGGGAGLFAVGIVFAVVGTPLWIVGSTKKRNAKNAYFREFGELNLPIPTPPSPYLKLNSNSDGMGLAFVF